MHPYHSSQHVFPLLTLLSGGSDSRNRAATNSISITARERANMAGYWKVVKEPTAPLCLPKMENIAPIIGPKMNPRENATPIKACVCMCVHVCACVHVFVCVHTCVCVCMCVNVYMYVCVHAWVQERGQCTCLLPSWQWCVCACV